MNDQPRPVWLNREQRDALHILTADSYYANATCGPVISAWDAAPADATEVVREAVSTALRTGESSTEAVLRALGHPS